MFRISLREMFALVAAIALAIVSLRSGSLFWVGVIGLIAMLAMGMAVIAGIFDHSQRRAFAIGAATLMVAYAAVVAIYRGDLNNVDTTLPTSVLLQSIHPKFDHSGYVYSATYDDIPHGSQMSSNSDGTYSVNGQLVYFLERPPLREFMRIGHSWFLLLFGYLGGRFARFVYQQRTKEQPRNI